MSNTPSRSVGLMATCLPISALDAFQRLPRKLMRAAVSTGRDNVVGAVFEGLDRGIERARAGLIAIGRHRQAQRIVRAVVIVAMPPGVKGALGLLEIVEGAPVQKFGLERAIEALVLAMVLRMERRGYARVPHHARSATRRAW